MGVGEITTDLNAAIPWDRRPACYSARNMTDALRADRLCGKMRLPEENIT